MEKLEFRSAQELHEYLQQHEFYVFTSKPKRLRHISILLYALAGGDFNSAHIIPGFEKYSIFKGIVSHGSGIICRAEGYFVNNVQFTEQPVEIVASGFESLSFRKPLRLHSVYCYEFKIYNFQKDKMNWKFDCDIVCKTTYPKQEVIAEWKWKPIFVEHSKVPKNELMTLKPKGYFSNVLKHLLFRPGFDFGLYALSLFFLGFGPVYLLLECFNFVPLVDVGLDFCI